MKKLFISILALFTLNSVFAGDFYSSDIQIIFGLGEDSATYNEGSFNLIKHEYKNTNMNIEVESWNIFKLNSLFGLGFMLSGEAGITKTASIIQKDFTHTQTSIPEQNLSFALQWSTDKIDSFAGFGWGVNLNAKLFPNTPTCFVAGVKLLSTFPEKLYYGTDTSSIKMYEMDSKPINDANNLYMGFYIGTSFNL